MRARRSTRRRGGSADAARLCLDSPCSRRCRWRSCAPSLRTSSRISRARTMRSRRGSTGPVAAGSRSGQSLDRRLATPVYVYWLIRWYVPRLNAASAEVARRHELVADRVAAKVAGSRAAADALVVFESGARFADDTHWPTIQISHETAAEPPRPYSQMLTWNARMTSTDVLDELFAGDTEPEDTHPSLRERFARLDEAVRIPPPAAGSAGEEILGVELEKLAGRLDHEWIARNGESWTSASCGVSRSKSHARSAGGHRDSHRRRTVQARGAGRDPRRFRRGAADLSVPPRNRVTRQRVWRPVACSLIEWTRRASPWSKTPWIATTVWCRKHAGFSRSTTKRPIRNSRLESANGAPPGHTTRARLAQQG